MALALSVESSSDGRTKNKTRSSFDEYDKLLKKLGKYSTGKACLYIKKLEDVDTEVLKELVNLSVKTMSKNIA